MPDKKYILNKQEASLKIKRLALEVAEILISNKNEIIIIGIKKNGVTIAEKVAELLKQYVQQPLTVLQLSLNKATANFIELSENIDFTNKYVLLCDDVVNSGKTLLYALKPILEQYPASIQTLVLVERMHTLFPIKADFVGISLTSTLQNNIVVEIENNEITGAYLE
ncbi:MAG TPA: phosphoribosyltransferase family protein [Chitinophagaceae bacterium]|nr:phosphoribosyltransferase [Chitinophagaceae bacterium]HMZ47287.1 phosphoribosyltransferase family protein [Chitinophagaceae bacterium]HNE93050.1 phosphoribosyltransferase family protein [Chitinophagaceae bacterium]HNF29262.1 phosphoribosyltransferase family protein [Chitinophagaceae bacterium]HNL82526.1 phosphoribosyltransferase family protein [Chitinophagaceae bacterium]